MKEIKSKPLAAGSIASAVSTTNKGRTISDVAIAEQFCIVAGDMRSILQSLRNSNDIQKATVETIQENSAKLVKLDAVVDKLDTVVDKLDIMIGHLVTLADDVKQSDATVSKAVKENQRHVDTMQIFLQLLEQHVDHLDESSNIMARSLLEDGAYTTLVNKVRQEKAAARQQANTPGPGNRP